MLAQKRVWVAGPNVAPLIRALAEAEGLVTIQGDDPGDVDLIVLEAGTPDAVGLVIDGHSVPTLVIADKRLRDSQLRAFRAAGATLVIDRESSLLDVAFAFSELLFESRQAHRRYDRSAGGLGVMVRPGGHGRLLGITKSGGFIQTEAHVDEGTQVELSLDIAGRQATLRGRVGFTRPDGFRVEFCIDDSDVAPSLFAMCDSQPPLALA